MSETPLLDWRPPDPYPAKGDTFSQERDGPRLNAQCLRVLRAFSDGAWHTLDELAEITGDPQASISARKRDLCRFGFKIEREYVKDGLHRYRLITPKVEGKAEDLGAHFAECHKLRIAAP